MLQQREVALRQEGHVYRCCNNGRSPSVRRAMFIEQGPRWNTHSVPQGVPFGIVADRRHSIRQDTWPSWRRAHSSTADSINIALLAEGAPYTTRFYRHRPPAEGQ